MNYFNFCLLGNFFTSPSILMDKFAFWIIPVWQFLFFECYEYITLLPSGLQVLVAQSCLILCDPMDCSPLGFSVHGIFQARILEWVAISFSRGFSQLRDPICVSFVSCIVRQILYQSVSQLLVQLNVLGISVVLKVL